MQRLPPAFVVKYDVLAFVHWLWGMGFNWSLVNSVRFDVFLANVEQLVKFSYFV